MSVSYGSPSASLPRCPITYACLTHVWVVGDGDPQDPLAEETYEPRTIRAVPVLRLARLFDVPCDREHSALVLLVDVQVLLCLCS